MVVAATDVPTPCVDRNSRYQKSLLKKKLTTLPKMVQSSSHHTPPRVMSSEACCEEMEEITSAVYIIVGVYSVIALFILLGCILICYIRR